MVKGAVQGVVGTRLQRLFAAMHPDPVLDYGAAACVLLTTVADLVVRFGVFLVLPVQTCKIVPCVVPRDVVPTLLCFSTREGGTSGYRYGAAAATPCLVQRH